MLIKITFTAAVYKLLYINFYIVLEYREVQIYL